MSRLEPVLLLGLDADPTADPSTWARTDASGCIRWKTLNIVAHRQDEGTQTDPSKARAVFDNRDLRFSRRNPLSPWYGQLRKDTPMWIQLRRVRDAFGRTASSAWGSPDYGAAWATAGGSASDYSVSAGYGKHSVAATNSFRYTVAGVNLAHPEMLATVNVAVLASGASLRAALVSRYQDISNYYYAEVILNTDQTISINVGKTVAGVFTQLATSSSTGVTHTVGRRLRIRFRTYGSTVSAKVWDESLTEPSGWQVTATDTALTAPGKVGCRSLRATGNTSGTTVFNFDDVAVTADLWTGWVPEWTPRWDKSTRDSRVPIEGAGILRRLTSGEQPEWSPLRRAVPAAAGLLEYWPIEDSSEASSVASAIDGGSPLVLSGGSISFGTFDAAHSLSPITTIGSRDLADIAGGGTLSGTVRASTATQWAVQIFTQNNTGATDLTVVEWSTPGGSFVRWQFVMKWSDTSMNVVAYDATNTATTIITTTGITSSADIFTVDANQNGANIDVRLFVRGGAAEGSGTAASKTLAPIRQVKVNPAAATTGVPWPIGHLSVWETKDPPHWATTFPDAYGGLDLGVLLSGAGEPAHTRLVRTTAEDGIRFRLTDNVTDADLITRMGVQLPATAIDIYRQAEDADLGILFEDDHGLAYIPRSARYNRGAEFTTTFDRLADAPQPSDDDQLYRNRVEVNRVGGSSAVALAEDYTDGDVIRPQKKDLVLYADTQLPDQAGFRARLGSVDEYRWPEVVINFAANPDLIDAFLNVRPGSRFVATGPPDQVAGSVIDAVIEGWTVDELTPDNMQVTFNLTPYRPWVVFQLNSATYGRLAYAGQTLNGAHNASTTALSVATQPGKPLVTTAGGDMPYSIVVDGEQMSVTAASGASSPQTATVTRGTNLDGTGISHDPGALVQLANPAYLAL